MSAATILIADDDQSIRTVLSHALGRLGHEVRTTGTAANLWRWISNGEGDLIITDVVMPDENGLDMIPRIRKLRPELRIIVMSAQNTLITAVRATERGAFEYLPKPFDLKEPKVNLMKQLSSNKGDIEEQMNLMRNFKQSMIFKLAIQEEMQIYPTEKISDALADIADLIVQEALLCVWKTLYPKIAFPKLGIIAYGKFGGKEMSYLSDLDMVFVYDDNKPVSRDKLVKLTQRFNSWMTSHTASGILYDIDFRLRPDGGSGILVSSWDTFDEYQMHKSQTWENQAITRARFLSDDRSLTRKFNKLRDTILRKKRDIVKLRNDVRGMRERIYRNKKPTNDLFDLKHSRGGLVDIEFITQFYILAYSFKYNELTENIGNIALLEKIASLGFLNQTDAKKLIFAYRAYRGMQHKQGLNPKNPGKVNMALASDHAINVHKIWKKLLE